MDLSHSISRFWLLLRGAPPGFRSRPTSTGICPAPLGLAPPLPAQISLSRLLGPRPRPSGLGLRPCSPPWKASGCCSTVPGQAPRVTGALRSIMQFLGGRRRSRSRELYLLEQSRRVAALNGQRLGKGRTGHQDLRRRGCRLGQDAD